MTKKPRVTTLTSPWLGPHIPTLSNWITFAATIPNLDNEFTLTLCNIRIDLVFSYFHPVSTLWFWRLPLESQVLVKTVLSHRSSTFIPRKSRAFLHTGLALFPLIFSFPSIFIGKAERERDTHIDKTKQNKTTLQCWAHEQHMGWESQRWFSLCAKHRFPRIFF